MILANSYLSIHILGVFELFSVVSEINKHTIGAMCIIGITGTIGAGKGTVVEYLVQSRGFVHLSVRKLLEEILAKQGRPIDRDQMFELANNLRGTNGADYIARKLYEQALQQHQPVIIESIRALAEVETLRNMGNFTLLGVDAPLHVRYQRILERGNSTDHIDFDKFVMQEQAEMQSDDPTRQNLTGCLKAADYVITNDGSIDELHKKIEEILEKVGI